MNKFEKGSLKEEFDMVCFTLAVVVLEKKIFKVFSVFRGFSLPVRKIFGMWRTKFEEANPRNIPVKN